MRRRYFLILAVVAALVVLAAVLVHVGRENRIGQQPEAERKGVANESPPSRSAKAEAGGREHCRQKCAALHKGYVYRARRNTAAEYCGCV